MNRAEAYEVVGESIMRRFEDIAAAFIAGTESERAIAAQTLRYVTIMDLCELWAAWGVGLHEIESTEAKLENLYADIYDESKRYGQSHIKEHLDASIRTIAASKHMLGRAAYYGDLFSHLSENGSANDNDDDMMRWMSDYDTPQGAWVDWTIEELDFIPDADDWIASNYEIRTIQNADIALSIYNAIDPAERWWSLRFEEGKSGVPHVNHRYEVSLIATISTIDYESGQIMTADWKVIRRKHYALESRAGQDLARNIILSE